MTIRRISLLLYSIQNVANSAFVPHQTHAEISRHTQTHLNMKNSHRARVEKNLEDMMGNDWRMFRAQLVAQETAEKKTQAQQDPYSTYARMSSAANQASQSSSTNASSSNHHSNKNLPYDEKQAKQEKFGNIFAAIFNNNKDNQSDNHDVSSTNTKSSSRSGKSSIFDGLHVGGATPDSMIPETCEDPFVSAAELPVLLQPKVQVDKHRWAHPLSHIEPGCVLIANEKLGGVFHQTVVLIVEHNEGAGSTGIVINRLVKNDAYRFLLIISVRLI